MHNTSDLGSSHVSCIESGSPERSEFTLSSIALARARVIGPSGVVGGVGASMGMIVGCSASHEFQLSKKRDIYGPNYGRSRALKAKVVSSSEEESDCSSGDPEDIGKELSMLVRKLQKFSKKNRFGKSSRSSSRNDEASSRDYKKRTCHKYKKLGHYISECPQWDKESKKKKKSKEYDSDDKKK